MGFTDSPVNVDGANLFPSAGPSAAHDCYMPLVAKVEGRAAEEVFEQR